ncbi:MAG: hypothetical protein OEU92_35125 [Alphaproteobacteria bacterium]|nr:hypothetical protein [Alphaproteobacteria bacterium]
MAKPTWRRAVPLALAALLVLGGCDDEDEKNLEVEVHVPKGVDLKVKRAGDDDSEMIIVGELALFTTLVVWALFGPGATRRFGREPSENG